jgi:segregation and condensation protein A
MAEKTLPWWRRALNFALDGIRSGFGLFTRSANSQPGEEPELLDKPEAPLEEKITLPQQPANPEASAIEPSAAPEPAPVAQAPLAAVPAPEPEVEPLPPVEPVVDVLAEPVVATEPVVALTPAAEPEVPTVSQISVAPAPEPVSALTFAGQTEPAAVPEPVPAAQATPAALPAPEPEVATVVETLEEAVAEPMVETVVEPAIEAAANPAETIEAVAVPAVAEPVAPIRDAPIAAAPNPVAPELKAAAAAIAPPQVIAPQPAPEQEPVTKAFAEPLAELASEPPAVPVPETVLEPAPELEVHTVEPPAACNTGEPVTELEPAKELVAGMGPEPELAPAAETLPAAELEEPVAPDEPHIDPPVESVSPIEPAAVSGQAPSFSERSEPEPEVSAAQELPAESGAASFPEPPAASIAEPAPEPAPEPASPVETADEPPAARPEIPPVTEAVASPEPAAEPQTPATAEDAPAPEAGAPAKAAPQPVVDEKAAARLAARQKKLDEADEESPFSVIVDHVYDGPLDLLLDLIRKQDIDIYDIPIAKITSQFLAYVNQLKAGDVDVAGEFIYTASLLIHIKSKMLLPRAPVGPDDTPEDPRRELVERLLEHERFKNAAQMLQQKQMLEAASWTNPGAQEFKDDASAEPEIAADTVDLVRIFRDILERARKRPVIDMDENQVTVGQMIQFLARRLTMEDKPVALRRLLSHTRSERALIAMFLALLELVRLQAILLRQDRAFSEIFIKKNTGFDAVMNEGLVNAHDEWR